MMKLGVRRRRRFRAKSRAARRLVRATRCSCGDALLRPGDRDYSMLSQQIRRRPSSSSCARYAEEGRWQLLELARRYVAIRHRRRCPLRNLGSRAARPKAERFLGRRPVRDRSQYRHLRDAPGSAGTLKAWSRKRDRPAGPAPRVPEDYVVHLLFFRRERSSRPISN